MTKIKNCLFLAIALLAATHCHGQTLHVIGFAATNDERIGSNCEVDLNGFFNMTMVIASMTGYTPQYYWGYESNCNKDYLRKTLASLDCGENDIVIFYYTGHGGRDFGDTNRFPFMVLNGKTKGEYVHVQSVIDRLSKSKARFKLILTDCCNMPPSNTPRLSKLPIEQPVYLTTAPETEANYRKLFVEAQGLVAVTSSSAGEYSSVTFSVDDEPRGSIFSIAFNNSLAEIVTGATKENTTWHNLLKHVNDKMKYMVQPTQTAAYTIMFAESTWPSGPAPSPTPVLAENKGLAADLAELVDRTLPLNYRLGKVDAIAKKWFVPDAQVASMARNGNLVLDYYNDPKAFLRHVAITDAVARLILLRDMKAENGKLKYIEVQEVRKQID
ncbi:MAG: caspase family protein [Bacteroidales bacterium]|nr:caspase family protein [Bacteroidales bacterium]